MYYLKVFVLFSCLILFSGSTMGGDDAKVSDTPEMVDAIDWNKLAELIPENIKGYEAGKLDGGTFSMANPADPSSKISHSSVERKYTKELEDSSLKVFKITIMDSGLNRMMITPFIMHMEYDTPDGYMKWTTVDDRKTALIVDKDEGKIDKIHIFTILADRLIVSVEGNENTTVEESKEIVSQVNFDALSDFFKTSVTTEKK